MKNKDLYDAESSDEDLPDIPRHAKSDSDNDEDSNVGDASDNDETVGEVNTNDVEKSGRRGGERKSAQAAMMEIR